jgi:glycosyltransferase involved in cell wall biosynthesis
LEPDYFSELQGLVRTLGLSNCFHFAGGITNLREHLSTSDIFVLPSRSEGFSNAIVEAMAASLPVVATNVGGNAEAVEEGVTGFIVPVDDPAALSEAISRLIANPFQAKAMGEAGRNLVMEKFTTTTMMDKITAAYKKLLLY